MEPGRAATFRLGRAGDVVVEAFVVNHDGRHHAYVNCCPHAGHRLDGAASRFFTDDGRLLVCSAHGAVFAPDTGVCVEGPCPGARLQPLAVARDGASLAITWPT